MARNEIKIRLSTTGKGKTEREIKGVNKSITNLAKSALTLAAAYKGVTFALESVKLAGKLKDLETAHKNLAKAQGLNAKAMIEGMQKATRGTVSELDLLQQANNALLLGLPVTEKDMANLADAGRRLGRAMGIDAAMGLESLVVGIGRGSKLWLDNLGIIVDTDRAYKDHAASIGKQASELTDAEKKLAFYNETMKSVDTKMKQLGTDQETITDKIERASVAWENIKTTIGEVLALPIAKTFEAATKRLEDFKTTTEETVPFIDRLQADIKKAPNPVKDLAKAFIEFIRPAKEAKEIFKGFVGPLPKIVTPEDIDTIKELTEEQKKIKEIQDKILQGQADRLIAEQALLDLKIQGLVPWEAGEQAQNAINRGLGNELEIRGLSLKFMQKQIVQEKLLLKARKDVNLELKETRGLFFDISQMQIENINAARRYAQELTRGVVLFQGMDEFAKSVVRSLTRMAQQLAQRVFAGLLGGVFGFVASGGNPLGFAAGFKSAGNFQEGGRPPVGRVSIVGERGPEPFIPDRPGTILPTEALGGNTLNVYVQGAFVGDIDQFAEEIANRSDQNFNRIKVNA